MPLTVLSKNIRYMRLFTGVPRKGCQLSNDNNAWPVTVNFKVCTYLRPICVTWPCLLTLSSIVNSSRAMWLTVLNEKNEVSYFSAK